MLNEYSLSLVYTPLTVDEVIKLLHVSRRDVTRHITSALIDAYDSNRSNICSSGIHFFVDKQAAIDYYIR